MAVLPASSSVGRGVDGGGARGVRGSVGHGVEGSHPPHRPCHRTRRRRRGRRQNQALRRIERPAWAPGSVRGSGPCARPDHFEARWDDEASPSLTRLDRLAASPCSGLGAKKECGRHRLRIGRSGRSLRWPPWSASRPAAAARARTREPGTATAGRRTGLRAATTTAWSMRRGPRGSAVTDATPARATTA